MEKTPEKIIRIAIVGPESTGKTTLASQLAKYYNTCFVPEYAREYIDALKRPYTLEDIVAISKGQIEMEDKMAVFANNILICDTNLVVTKIWAEHKYKTCPVWITEAIVKRHYNLHLLTYPDLPWEPDPQREHPHLLNKLYVKYRTELNRLNISYATIQGMHEKRLQNAVNIINSALHINP